MALAAGSIAFMARASAAVTRRDDLDVVAGAQSPSSRARRSGTKSPLRAVAMRVPASPSSATRSASVAAARRHASPLTMISRPFSSAFDRQGPLPHGVAAAPRRPRQFNRIRPETSRRTPPVAPRVDSRHGANAMNIGAGRRRLLEHTNKAGRLFGLGEAPWRRRAWRRLPQSLRRQVAAHRGPRLSRIRPSSTGGSSGPTGSSARCSPTRRARPSPSAAASRCSSIRAPGSASPSPCSCCSWRSPPR